MTNNADVSFLAFKDYISTISDPDDFKKIFVTNLPNKYDEKELKILFGKYGKVEKAIRAQPKKNNKVEPFGYITFEDPEVAKKVIALEKINTDRRPILIHSFTSNEVIKLF
jgi:RNA recognition motif-containing protein